MIEVKIKTLSVNEVWQGKRFKTQSYKNYEKAVLFMLPKIQLQKPPYRVDFEFGFSNVLSDIDNPIKPIFDILQKKYGINDRDIYELVVRKIIVKKGQEYFKFNILHIE